MKSKSLILVISIFILANFALTGEAKEKTIIDDSRELYKQIQMFSDSITIIGNDYVKPINVKDLVYGAIKGMMNTLDGYSQFLDPESFKEIREETKGEFGGIGIEIGVREGVLTVIAPIEGTPAYEAGLESDDKIVKIDGEITREMTLDDAVKKLRGEVGEKVTITVIREDEDKMLDFTMTRAIIKLESIKEAKIIKDNIAYVRLVEFQERTARDLRKEIKRLVKKGAKSLILDLRNNPGGLLESSVQVSDIFLEPKKLIVYTEGRDPDEKMEFYSKKRPDFKDLDMVVLVNKGSASASEILAGALKDNKRALIVGVDTFGKGSVQTVIPLKDKSALRLTTAAYYTPNGNNLMDKGIEPDIYVKRIREPKKDEDKKDDVEEKKKKLFEKIEKPEDKEKKKEKEEKEEEKFDNQLMCAINVLKGLHVFEEYKSSEEKE